MGNLKRALEVCLLFLGTELQQLFRSINWEDVANV